MVNITVSGKEGVRYVGRGSALGNPFTSIQGRQTKAEKVVGSRDESVDSYASWLRTKVADKDPKVMAELKAIQPGDKLGCYCAPKRCHAEEIWKVWKDLKSKGEI